MKKNPILISFFIVLSLFFSCKHEVNDLPQVAARTILKDAQINMQAHLKTADFADLDWAKASISSLDPQHQANLLYVQSKSNPKKALYYSFLNQVTTAYLVTLNLPEKITSPNEVNGTIEIYSEKNILLRKFTVIENRVVYYDEADKKTAQYRSNSKLKDGNVSTLVGYGDCDGQPCSIPPCVVTGVTYNSKASQNLISMLFTYGGGTAYYISGPAGQYGGGGSFSSVYYDKYQPNGGGSVTVIPFVDQIPDNQGSKLSLSMITNSEGKLCKVVDNKSFINFNVTIQFQLDKNSKVVKGKTEVQITGFTTGTYKLSANQPDVIYDNTGQSMLLNIAGIYSYGFASINCPISVSLDGLKTFAPTAKVLYSAFMF